MNLPNKNSGIIQILEKRIEDNQKLIELYQKIHETLMEMGGGDESKIITEEISRIHKDTYDTTNAMNSLNSHASHL